MTSEIKAVMGSSYSTFTADARLAGYTPIAITRIGHTHPGALNLVSFDLSGDKCVCLLANRTTTRLDGVHASFDVVYAKAASIA